MQGIALLWALWALRVMLVLPASGYSLSADLWSPDGVNWWCGDAAARAGAGPPVSSIPAVYVYPFKLEPSDALARLGLTTWAVGRIDVDRVTWTAEVPPRLDKLGILAAARRFDAATQAPHGLTQVVLGSPAPPTRTATVVHRTVYWGSVGVLALAALVAGVCLHGLWLVVTRGARARRHIEQMKEESRCVGCGHLLLGIPRHLPCPECGRQRE